MATTPIEIPGLPPGLTLTADIYPRGNDTAWQTGIALTEETNRKGTYTGTVTAAASGWVTLKFRVGTDYIAELTSVQIEDTADKQILEAGFGQATLEKQEEILEAIGEIETGGDATLEKQTEILTAIGEIGELTAEVDAEELAAELAPLIWDNPVRTLTQSTVSPDEETTTDQITRRRGDTWSISITGLGSIADRDTLWMTIKKGVGALDAAAVLQITEADGITVDDEDAGNVTIAVGADTTAGFEPRDYVYDIQVLRTGGQVQTLAIGTFTVAADVTRATE